jgi:hypothetical protein
VHKRLSPAPLVLLAFVTACKPHLPSAPPNDIAIRIEWSGPADLDLFVREPDGTEISRQHKQSASGAIYTGDCNATPDTMCAAPMEMVYWRTHNAPKGVFQYRVLLENNHLQALPVTFKIEVLHGTTIVSEEEGSIQSVGRFWGPRDARWK